MAFQSPFLTLLAAVLLVLGVCGARSIPTGRSTLWTRRIYDGSNCDADSDQSTSNASSTTASFTTDSNDNSDNDDSTSTSSISSISDTCLKTKNVTRIIQNDDGYGSYYSSGVGRYPPAKTAPRGGTTPDGSGTAPRFDNSTGAFMTLADDDAANTVDINDQHYLSYLGGAAIPLKSGTDSPNGVLSKKLDNLPFATVDKDNVKDGSCAVPNTSYAYEFQSKYSLRSASNISVYCLCDPLGSAMLAYMGLEVEAKNASKICTISLDGATTILVNGGLSNGFTKAGPDADEVLARVPRTKSTRCGGDGGGTGVAVAVSVDSWLLGMLSLGIASLLWL
ncbi:hypothetical protein BDW75DRAFT_230523 [Aspergillus navahoensis]